MDGVTDLRGVFATDAPTVLIIQNMDKTQCTKSIACKLGNTCRTHKEQNSLTNGITGSLYDSEVGYDIGKSEKNVSTFAQ